MTKSELYSKIEILRFKMSQKGFSFPYNSKDICVNGLNLILEETPLKSLGIRGVSLISSYMVVLDNKISAEEQNFFCMHENIHHVLHKNVKTKVFNGYEKIQSNQNPIIEWEANEGAAQFLVPYQAFIPNYFEVSLKNAHRCSWDYDSNKICEELALNYNVTPGVIHNRLKNLRYEIYYYKFKRTLEGVKLYSNHELNKKNWNGKVGKTYCVHCLSPIINNTNYCHICGHIIQDSKKRGISRLGDFVKNTNEGVAYMKYKKYPTDEHGKLLKCLNCNNEELISDGRYCHICGTCLINKCAQEFEYNDSGTYVGSCHESEKIVLPTNARFCPYCGSPTLFSRCNLLPSYIDEQKKNESIATKSDDDISEIVGDDELPF